MQKSASAIAFVLLPALLLPAVLRGQEPAKPTHQRRTAPGASSSQGTSTDGPQVTVNVLRQDEYTVQTDGEKTTATMVEVVLDPLASSPPHRHPGPVSGYVLEGTFEFQVEGGELLTLKAGDHFFEPKMILHQVSRNPDKARKTRVLATIVHPSSAESITIMEPATKKSIGPRSEVR